MVTKIKTISIDQRIWSYIKQQPNSLVTKFFKYEILYYLNNGEFYRAIYLKDYKVIKALNIPYNENNKLMLKRSKHFFSNIIDRRNTYFEVNFSHKDNSRNITINKRLIKAVINEYKELSIKTVDCLIRTVIAYEKTRNTLERKWEQSLKVWCERTGENLSFVKKFINILIKAKILVKKGRREKRLSFVSGFESAERLANWHKGRGNGYVFIRRWKDGFKIMAMTACMYLFNPAFFNSVVL